VTFLILAHILPALTIGVAWTLSYRRRGWKAKTFRLKTSAALLTLAAYLLLSATIHAAAAMWSTCAQPDCTMGYVLGVALLFPVALFLACSGLLLRARPSYAIAGHILMALPIADFLMWALRTDYDSIITWAG
jgi:hypothetical protein